MPTEPRFSSYEDFLDRDVPTRVGRGINFLNEKAPGWFRFIDVAQLNQHSPYRCVLGQWWSKTHPNYEPHMFEPPYATAVGFFIGNVSYRSRRDWAIEHGFQCILCLGEDGALNEEWQRRITDLQEAYAKENKDLTKAKESSRFSWRNLFRRN